MKKQIETNRAAREGDMWGAVPNNDILRAGAVLQGCNEKLQRDARNVSKLLNILTDTWDGYNAARLALYTAKQKGPESPTPPDLVGEAKEMEEFRRAEDEAQLNGTTKLLRLREIAAAIEELSGQLESAQRRVLAEQAEISAEQAAVKKTNQL